MKPWKNGRSRRGNDDRRLTWLAAVVLLLIVGIVGRLFFVQVIDRGIYVKAATGQQDFFANLQPNRGKILIQDRDGSLYPLATNRDYVLIYAVPNQIKKASDIADKLYQFFKQADDAKAVDDQLAQEASDKLNNDLTFIKTLPAGEQAAKEADVRKALADPLYQAGVAKRREDLLNAAKQTGIANYQQLLTKQNDSYEVLEKRVEIDAAKQFHLALLALDNRAGNLKIDDLEIKNGHMLDKQSNQDLLIDGLNYTTDSYRTYPENNVAAHLLGFTAFDATNRNGQLGKHGNYGLEGYYDEELFGKAGSVKSAKGAGGLVLAQDRQVVGQQDGCDLVLTIDRSIQFYVDKVLREGVAKYKAEGGSILVLRPQTGEIMAMSSQPDFDPNKYNAIKNQQDLNNAVIFDQYEPGSVFKAITMASALDKGAVTPDTTYDDPGQIMIEGWNKPIKNSDYDTHGAHGKTTMVQVLENSLNTGAIFAMKSIGPEVFTSYVKNFGFGAKTGIELSGESAGNISDITAKKIRPISAATASFGQGVSVTPLQMAVSYGALANGGKLMKPYVVKEMDCGSQTTKNQPQTIRQVITPATSALISGMLVNVVEKGHSKRTQVAGYYIAGKTGTAQLTMAGVKGYAKDKYNHTFVGFGPVPNPQFVVLVELNTPKGFVYAESTAVPMAHDVINFMLTYLQIPKTR